MGEQLKYRRRDEIEAELKELKSRKCENCHYFISSDSNDWCTNETLNNQIDPDGQLDGWFTPVVGFSCSEWKVKDAE